MQPATLAPRIGGLDVIGLIGDTFGIIELLAGLFGSHTKYSSTVRIAAGLNGATGADRPGSLESAQGCIYDVKLYNEHRQLLGRARDSPCWTAALCSVGDGGYRDISVSQDSSQQATFVEIIVTNDSPLLYEDNSVYIPYVTVTMVDSSQYGWVGDWGMKCGLEWFYSDIYVDSSNHKPLCTWIDGGTVETWNPWDPPHDQHLRTESVMIHLPDFTTDVVPDDPSVLCKEPSFRHDEEDTWISAKASEPRARPPDNRLVFSSTASHNVTVLCESPTSRGPDFVNRLEGLYCNMETRQVLPLCTKDIKTGCFEVDSKQSLGSDGSAAAKNYSRVVEWSS